MQISRANPSSTLPFFESTFSKKKMISVYKNAVIKSSEFEFLQESSVEPKQLISDRLDGAIYVNNQLTNLHTGRCLRDSLGILPVVAEIEIYLRLSHRSNWPTGNVWNKLYQKLVEMAFKFLIFLRGLFL